MALLSFVDLIIVALLCSFCHAKDKITDHITLARGDKYGGVDRAWRADKRMSAAGQLDYLYRSSCLSIRKLDRKLGWVEADAVKEDLRSQSLKDLRLIFLLTGAEPHSRSKQGIYVTDLGRVQGRLKGIIRLPDRTAYVDQSLSARWWQRVTHSQSAMKTRQSSKLPVIPKTSTSTNGGLPPCQTSYCYIKMMYASCQPNAKSAD